MTEIYLSITQFIATYERNLRWIILLLGSILLSMYGVAVPNRLRQRTPTKRRSHNGIKLFNDFLARHQLSYVMFFLTLLIQAQMGDLARTFGIVLVLLAAFFYHEGVSQSLELGDRDDLHGNCSGAECHEPLETKYRLRLCRLNIFFASVLLVFAIWYSFLDSSRP